MNGHEPAEVIDFEIAIIGAGISGINAAYYIQTQGPVGISYAILEGRSRIGGTWDLFQYPGIRCDANIEMFAFGWNPWTGTNAALVSGEEIRKYLETSAEKYGIDEKIKYNHQVSSLGWSTKDLSWTITAVVGEEIKTFRSRFIVMGTGYYDYEDALEARIPGLKNFGGTIIHPQFWPEKLDYANKDVVVIGSGATAITLIPSLAPDAKYVTMLQRSPSYIFTLPQHDAITKLMRNWLPVSVASSVNRIRWALLGLVFYWFCRAFPSTARRRIVSKSLSQLSPPTNRWSKHFEPLYNPWDQRVCFSPDGDFFGALRSGKAGVATGVIKTVTEKEIVLESGEKLQPDIIITATGLKIRFAGGIAVSVDGVLVDMPSKFSWKGAMIQDVPNLVFIFGYLNQSWTLGADTTSQLLIRLLRIMKQNGNKVALPRIKHPNQVHRQPITNVTSTYLKNAEEVYPRNGTGQWRQKWNYFADMYQAKWGDINTDLELR